MKSKKPVIAYLHTHWDPEWYRTLDMFNIRLVEVFDKVLLGLENGEIPSFYFDGQVLALLSYLKYRPEKENLIKKFINERKLFIGPFFVSADNFLVSYESIKKNIELGISISKKFGQKDFIGYLSDTFGHSKDIFEVLGDFNIKYSIIWRGAGKIPSDFISNGIKTTRLVYGYYQDVLHSDFDFEKKASIIENVLDKINEFSGDILLLPLGGDHLSPPENPLFQIAEINKLLKKYEIRLSNPFEYLNLVDFSKFNYNGEFLDNSETFILPGVYSARISEKVKNAELQWKLFHKAYKFDEAFGSKFKNELDIASIELIKNHAHDSIYGCSIDNVHKMVRTRQVSVEETVDTVIQKTIFNMDKKSGLNVFNCSKYPQKGVVKVVSDKKIKNAQKIGKFKSVSDEIWNNSMKNPMTEDFHTFYEYLIETDNIKPLSLKASEPKAPVKTQIAGNDFIENNNLKLFILENKIFAINKKNNEIYSDFIQIIATKDGGDSYNFAPLDEGKKLAFKKSRLKVSGDIKSTLTLVFEENIELNVSLTNESEFFEFELDFINKKKNRKLQISINTKMPIQKTFAQDLKNIIERDHDPSYFLFYAMPAPSKKELKTNSYPMQRFVFTNNVGVITLGLNEYEIYQNFLKITFLRSTGIISNPENKARSVPAGPPIECIEMQELKKHKMKFAVTFNALEDLNRLADNFYNPFIGFFG